MNAVAPKNIPVKSVTLDGIVDGTATNFDAFKKAQNSDEIPSVPHCDTLDIRLAPEYPPIYPNELAAPPIVIG